jgi:hypothetical protein
MRTRAIAGDGTENPGHTRIAPHVFPHYVDQTLGFHAMKSVLEKAANMAAMSSHDSELVLYHSVQVLVYPIATGEGRVVTVGGVGKGISDPDAATQYQ